MYSGATTVDPAWINLLVAGAPNANTFEPTGWSLFIQRYLEARRKKDPEQQPRRYVYGDTLLGLQPRNLQDDEEMRLPDDFRRGRSTNFRKGVLEEDAEKASETHRISVTYKSYMRILLQTQHERGTLNGDLAVPGAPPGGPRSIPMPGLMPDVLSSDL
jgi:hypothetical protein